MLKDITDVVILAGLVGDPITKKYPFEAIIIGSGATGGVAAMTFAQSGIRTLVIEAGPHLKAEKALQLKLK